jgi:DNA-binding response OmpR family regulator
MNATIDRIEIVSEPKDAEAPNNSKSPVCVWLVDDDNEFRGLLAETLARQEGIDCARDFSSPDAMLSVLASQIGPDVIVMDVHMGERNGLDAIGPIKALSRTTQVLMLTSLSDEIERKRALNEGASDFLLKSYTPEEIVERIRNPHRRVNARRRRLVNENCHGKAERSAKVGNGLPRTNSLPERQGPLLKGGLGFLRRLLGSSNSR